MNCFPAHQGAWPCAACSAQTKHVLGCRPSLDELVAEQDALKAERAQVHLPCRYGQAWLHSISKQAHPSNQAR